MSALDPSYLRSIRDGILNGNIEANNIEALPDGLVGLYEKELFPPTMKWKERKERLEFFLVFAMAQKEISADFAAEILGDAWYKHADQNSTKEEKRLHRVNELIQVHSKRFSSAGSGKYRLYHERFRVYVLQKVSEKFIAQSNDKFIELCQTALNSNSEKDSPEKDSYALEFISTHFYISSVQGKTECLNKEHALALKKYAYDQKFWERQIKASKGFEWSKRMLNQMMSWASKFNEDEEVIECALNKVDLHHQEQNDAPRIVQLVADGDIQTALERIKKFGGEDKEGLQRKFILYMLCLMELTLLDSKNKDHAKGAIEKILDHIKNKFIFDISQVNWGKFFSGYLMFKISTKIDSFGLDFEILYKNTDLWSFDWIEESYYLNERELEILNEISKYHIRENNRIIDILTSKEIIQEIENGNIDLDISKLDRIKNTGERCITYAKIGFLLSNINSALALENFQIASGYAMSEWHFLNRFYLLLKVSKYLFLGGLIDKALKKLKELLNIINEHDDSHTKKEDLYANTFRELIFQNQSIFCLNELSKLKSKKYYEKLVKEVIIELVIKAEFKNIFEFFREIENNLDLLESLVVDIKRTSIKYDNLDVLVQYLEKENNIYLDYFKNQKNKSFSVNYELYFDKSEHLFKKGSLIESFNILKDIREVIISENKISSYTFKDKLNQPPSKVLDILDIKKSKFIKNGFELDVFGVYYSKLLCSLKKDNRSFESNNHAMLLNLFTSKNKSALAYIVNIFKKNVLSDYKLEFLDSLVDKGSFDEIFSLLDLVENDYKKIKFKIKFSARLHENHRLEVSKKIADEIKNEVNEYFEDFGFEFNAIEIMCEASKLFQNYFDHNYADYLAKKVYLHIINLESNEIIYRQEDIFKVLELQISFQRNIEIDKIIEKIRFSAEKIDKREKHKYDDILIALCKLLAKSKLFSKSEDVLLILRNNSSSNQTGQLELILNEMDNNNSKEYEKALSFIIESLIEYCLFNEAFSRIERISELVLKSKLLAFFYFKKFKWNNSLGYNGIYQSLEILKDVPTNSYSYQKNWYQIREKSYTFCFIAELFEQLNESKVSESVWNSAMTESEKILTTRYPERETNFVIRHFSNTVAKIIKTVYNSQKWYLAIEYSNKIKLSQLKQDTLKDIGKSFYESEGYHKSIATLSQLNSYSSRKYTVKGLIEGISIENFDRSTLLDLLKRDSIEVTDFEKLLQYNAIDELFFSNIPQEKLDRYNRTLNLQWAIDIKNQLVN
jgi:hypothetical protein